MMCPSRESAAIKWLGMEGKLRIRHSKSKPVLDYPPSGCYSEILIESNRRVTARGYAS